MKIKVEEALVKTATVEIKTLSIAGRQVTLAVFRQLQEESVVDYELLRLNGPVWGRINYHPDKWCSDGGGDHIHLVWQSGTELRRSHVGKDDHRHVMQRHDQAVASLSYPLLNAFACEGGYFEKESAYILGTKAFNIGGVQGHVHFETSTDPLAQLLVANAAIARGEGEKPNVYFRSKTSQQQIAQELRATLKTRSVQEIVEEIRNEQKERDAYQKEWETLYAKLKEVQQLFIAV
jgi:hypothetical protein